ncbi:MAG: tRNA (adenosine(37)-N6)-dimethylallyltransferase MiaA [Heliobacteriaceae bacterium]|nr:tRNA (adenosine(37)-N6)-dimethylallyltransferase MiaA [Heliobacteriaceae bacterium]MDD4586770.1 tRNA (adenosine(37)-N6)-dimethylallyltransferase MiaA [Heliobacteriaceae bacterium]
MICLNDRYDVNHLDPLVLVVGPTAVGKSAVAIELAKRFNGEIISGDSMQVYRGMDIGTAKLPFAAQGGIPHHLIDILDPDQPFSVAEFQRRVTRLIPEIIKRGRLPILVGGTGLYVRAVTDHYEFSEEAGTPRLRNELKAKAAAMGPVAFHALLQKLDPKAAGYIHVNDEKRIIRALEVYYLTGRPQSEFHYAALVPQPKYRLAPIALTMERQELYHRIDLRATNMIKSGLVEEVKGLIAKGYAPTLPAMQGLGYRQIVGYFRGDYDLARALYLIQRDTRRFAKRQYTWFRRDARLIWFATDVSNHNDLINHIQKTIEKIRGGI